MKQFIKHIFGKKYLLISILCLIAPICASAQEVTVDNLIYAVDPLTDTAFVKGGTNKSISEAIIKETVTIDRIEYPVTSVGRSAFSMYNELSSVTIPDNVTDLKDFSFFSCDKLTNITIPNSVTSIGKYAFQYDYNLNHVSIGTSVTSIGEYAFQDCGMESITIPASVQSIGSEAFTYCTKLKEIVFSGAPVIFSSNAFKNEDDHNYFNSVSIHSLTDWAGSDFEDYNANPLSLRPLIIVNHDVVHNLVLDLPDDSRIKKYTFYQARVDKVRIKADVVEEKAFNNCNMKLLCIDTKAIDVRAFANCGALKAVYSLTSIPPASADNAFTYFDGITLYVPRGAADAYRNNKSCWRKFENIVETDFADIDKLFKADYIDGNAGIESVEIDGNNSDCAKTVEIFNLNGVYVGNSTEDLTPGLYIIRHGNKVSKQIIR